MILTSRKAPESHIIIVKNVVYHPFISIMYIIHDAPIRNAHISIKTQIMQLQVLPIALLFSESDL